MIRPTFPHNSRMQITKQDHRSSDRHTDTHVSCRIFTQWFAIETSTVEAGYNEFPGSSKITSLYAACVITEAPDIKDSRHATSLYPERRS